MENMSNIIYRLLENPVITRETIEENMPGIPVDSVVSELNKLFIQYNYVIKRWVCGRTYVLVDLEPDFANTAMLSNEEIECVKSVVHKISSSCVLANAAEERIARKLEKMQYLSFSCADEKYALTPRMIIEHGNALKSWYGLQTCPICKFVVVGNFYLCDACATKYHKECTMKLSRCYECGMKK